MHKILIIEDDASITQILKQQLESWGNEVHCVKDFQHVIKAFTDFDPHLVLVDIILPFYNGYYWCSVFHFIMDTIGAVKSERFPMFLWYFSLLLTTI